MSEPDHPGDNDPAQAESRRDHELAWLFGRDTVEQAAMIDAADLNLTEEMTAVISSGLTRLKQLRRDPRSQQDLVSAMTPGERLVLCMWIRDMGLLDKIQSESYR